MRKYRLICKRCPCGTGRECFFVERKKAWWWSPVVWTYDRDGDQAPAHFPTEESAREAARSSGEWGQEVIREEWEE